jgi:hypothetical protein
MDVEAIFLEIDLGKTVKENRRITKLARGIPSFK